MADESITVHITYDAAEADAAAEVLRSEGYGASVVLHRGSHRVQVPGEGADDALALLGKLDDLVGTAQTIKPDPLAPIMPTWAWLIPALLATAAFVQTQVSNIGLAVIIWVIFGAIYGMAHKPLRRYWNNRDHR